MDYSHAAYFSGAQPYQFIGIPPLTPSHSNSAASEDYNTTSPPEVYSEFSNEQRFQNFEAYPPQFNHQQQPPQQQQQQFPGPPTPPNPAAVSAQGGAPVGTQPLNGGVATVRVKPHQGEIINFAKLEPGLDSLRQGGSNSDDDELLELTPAQSRRKAQNRAAQRAFRERKERHVRDLEAKLANLEASHTHAATENERLKRDLQKMSTENEILRATSSIQSGSPGSAAPTTTGPMTYNPESFYTELLAHHDNKTPSHRVATSPAGERLLAAGATWELIISHELFKKGLVDVADISNRLKNQAKCDGQGPVFEEGAIIMAIEQSVGSGSDELL